MIASTEQKARLLDLITSVLKQTGDGKRHAEEVADVLQVIKDDPQFGQRLLNGHTPQAVDVEALLSGWAAFYKEHFGITLDVANIRIPEKREGFDRLIVVAGGLTANQVYDVCAKHFQCWRYTGDLDTITHDRNTKEAHYAIWVRDRKEADEENRNISANQLGERGEVTETLIERLIHDLKYWQETGEHLDHENYTLCAGSRHPGGGVPSVYWYPRYREMVVGWYDPGGRCGGLRARSVVS